MVRPGAQAARNSSSQRGGIKKIAPAPPLGSRAAAGRGDALVRQSPYHPAVTPSDPTDDLRTGDLAADHPAGARPSGGASSNGGGLPDGTLPNGPLPAENLASAPDVVTLFEQRVAESADSPALRFQSEGRWHDVSWTSWARRSRCIASALGQLGFEPGSVAAIISRSRPEWVIAEMGAMMAGGITASVYESNLAEGCARILARCEAVVVFVEDPHQLVKVVSHRAALPKLRHIVVFDPTLTDRGRVLDYSESDPGIMTLEALEALGRDSALPATPRSPDSVATIVYTPGTAGPSKGVMLTHANLVAQAAAVQVLGLRSTDVQLLYLPLSHAFARMLVLAVMQCGATTAFCRNPLQAAREVRPTVIAAAPRLFEGAYARLEAAAHVADGLRLKLFQWAQSASRDLARAHQQGRDGSVSLGLRQRWGRHHLSQRANELFGGQTRLLISGHAPLSDDIVRFFFGLGMEILEGYGLTETAAATHVNRPGAIRFGTVGTGLPGVETRIADDGEILVRGPALMAGYQPPPAGSDGAERDIASALTNDGWLHTGDIGRLDRDGALRVLGRKDELIRIEGRLVSPLEIEKRLQSSPYIHQALVYGDEREFLVALLTLDRENIYHWATERGVAFQSISDLAASPMVFRLMDHIVAQVNASLPSFETIRKFAIMERDFTAETGELTPTHKLRRTVVTQKHRALFDSFYREQY